MRSRSGKSCLALTAVLATTAPVAQSFGFTGGASLVGERESLPLGMKDIYISATQVLHQLNLYQAPIPISHYFILRCQALLSKLLRLRVSPHDALFLLLHNNNRHRHETVRSCSRSPTTQPAQTSLTRLPAFLVTPEWMSTFITSVIAIYYEPVLFFLYVPLFLRRAGGARRHQHQQHRSTSSSRSGSSGHASPAWRRPSCMSAEGTAAPAGVTLSTELLPAETLERSKVGNKFEKTKCAKPGDMMFTEV